MDEGGLIGEVEGREAVSAAATGGSKFPRGGGGGGGAGEGVMWS